MGQGDVGGNGSVQWTFVHHDAGGAIAPLNHSGVMGPPGNNEVKVAGNRAVAKDPIEFIDIGSRPGLVPGHFKITVTFASNADARAAIPSAPVGNSLVLFVPAIDRTIAANKGRPIEVRVEW